MFTRLVGTAGLIMLLTGCGVKTWVIQQDFKPEEVKRIGVVVPSVQIRMIDISNDVTIDTEQSGALRAPFEKAVVEGLKQEGFDAFLISNKSDEVTFLKGYGLIASEIRKHFPNQGTPTQPSKIDGFAAIKASSKVDCIAAVDGLEHKSTPGRKAKMAGLALLGVSGGQGLTHITMGLFCGDDGKPMFFEHYKDTSDLFDTGNVSKISSTLVSHAKQK